MAQALNIQLPIYIKTQNINSISEQDTKRSGRSLPVLRILGHFWVISHPYMAHHTRKWVPHVHFSQLKKWCDGNIVYFFLFSMMNIIYFFLKDDKSEQWISLIKRHKYWCTWERRIGIKAFKSERDKLERQDSFSSTSRKFSRRTCNLKYEEWFKGFMLVFLKDLSISSLMTCYIPAIRH